MSVFSSLTAPLLFGGNCGTNAASLNSKSEDEETTSPIFLCSSPDEFMYKVHRAGVETRLNSTTNGKRDSTCEADEVPIITQTKSDPHPPLIFAENWTFASSPLPEGVKDWSAMTTGRLDHVLETWSQLTTHLVSPHVHQGTTVSFFPARLPTCIAPFVGGRSDSVFYEVLAHIPIQLFYQPLPDSDTTDNTGDVSDTLAEFAGSGRMYARRLRALMHDTVIGFMSNASHAAPENRLWRCNKTVLRETSCVSGETSTVGDEEVEEIDGRNDTHVEEETVEDETLSNDVCNYNKVNVKTMHQLLSSSLCALAPPTPVLLSMRVENRSGCDSGDNVSSLPDERTTTSTTLLSSSSSSLSSTPAKRNTFPGKTENGEVEGRDVRLIVHTVVRVARAQVEQQQQEWNVAAIAFEVLTRLFPGRFVLRDANSLAVGEVLPNGHITNLRSFTTPQLLAARWGMRTAGECLLPSPASIFLSPSLVSSSSPPATETTVETHTTTTATTTKAAEGTKATVAEGRMGVRVQHDPYSVLTWTFTDYEPQTSEKRKLESTEETLGMSGGASITDCTAILTQHEEGKGDVDVSQNAAQGSNAEVSTTPTTEDDAEELEEVPNQVQRKLEEEEEEEEEELDIQKTKQVILSICEEIAASRRQWTEKQPIVETQLNALFLQSVEAGETSLITPMLTPTTGTTRRKKNKLGKHSTDSITSTLVAGDAETVQQICGFFGVSPLVEDGGNNSGDAALSQQRLIKHVTNGPTSNGVYIDMDQCVRYTSEIVQTLENRLRAEALRVQHVHHTSRRPLNGEVVAKNSRKKKNEIPLFAAAAKGILQEHQRHTGALSRRADEIGNNNDSSNNNNFNNSEYSVVLQCTVSRCKEAYCSIDEACEKLRAAAVWGRQRVVQLHSLQLLCGEVLLPSLQGCISVWRHEEKERERLCVDYTVSDAILRESEDRRRRNKLEEVLKIPKGKRADPHTTTGTTTTSTSSSSTSSTGSRAIGGSATKLNGDHNGEKEEVKEHETTDTLRGRGCDVGESQTLPQPPHSHHSESTATMATTTTPAIALSVCVGKGKRRGVVDTSTPRATSFAGFPVESAVVTSPLTAAPTSPGTRGRVGYVSGGGKKRSGVLVETKWKLPREWDALQLKTFFLFVVCGFISVFVFLFL